jgi:erythronate-4-phosphate dehydrogenase
VKKLKIVADDKIPFIKGVLEPVADIYYLSPSQISKDIIKDADALLIRTRTKCNAELLSNSSIKFIATATIGFDHIDTTYCDLKGIKWVNAPGCNSGSVQQYIASALLTAAKQNNISLTNKTLGIIGVGNVGSKVEKIAKIFGMKVLLNDPPRERSEGNEKFVSVDELIKNSDIITFHVPLNLAGIDKTFHLANEVFFEKLIGSKIFINTSRGEVVDEGELKRAIRDKKVTTCILDVWSNEPSIDAELLSLTNIASPHIAGYSVEGKANGTAACVNAVNEFFNLGIKPNWYPQNLPAPNKSKDIKIDCNEKSTQEVIYDCISTTYNIIEDDIKLRNSIAEFEKQRAEYPSRREFNYYDVYLSNAEESLSSAISELGFNTKIN